MTWNGNQREKKGNDTMKRLAILSVITVFAASSIAAAPLSFAAVTNSDKSINNTTQTYDNDSEMNENHSSGSDEYDSDSDSYSDGTYSDDSYSDGSGTDKYESEDNDSEDSEDSGVEKDTSWFDYYDQKDTYEISNEAELLGFASLVNENQSDKWKPDRVENFSGVTFVLTKDIKITTEEWVPVGSGGASHFDGIFDGGGHTISGINIDSSSGTAGFFGYLKGEVRNLTVKGTIKSGDGVCGGIAGQLDQDGKIVGCTSEIKVSAKDKTGGIVGYNNGGKIKSCTNLGQVSGTYKVGGIVGENWGGTVKKCANKAKVKSSRRGVATYGTGGIAGRSVSADAEVAYCYNSGEIISNTEATGGVVGYINASGSTVLDCYNTAKVIVKNKGNKKNAAKAYAGGIVGIAGATDVYIRNCYNSAAVLNADANGGVVGYYINEDENTDNIRYLRNNYYLNENASAGIGLIEDDSDRKVSRAAAGISSTSMSGLASSLTEAYKDDLGIYGNNGYPVLQWQTAVDDDQRVYMNEISKEVQDKLDKYNMKSSGTSQYGQIILNFFTPDNYTNDAMLQYNGSKDDIKAKVRNAE